MSIENENDLKGLLKIGRVVAETLREMEAAVRPGITTRALDQIAAAVLLRYGARPAPMLTYAFPGVACISMNDEAAHGIPGDRVVQPGDLVKLDVSAELGGYYADAAITVGVAPLSPEKQKLLGCAQSALQAALSAARAGNAIREIGRAAEGAARRCGYKVVGELPGHGVGRALHEAPDVPNVYLANHTRPLREGLVITVEPHVSAGSAKIRTSRDGWTLRTPDGSPVANFEHTIIITRGDPIVVTAL